MSQVADPAETGVIALIALGSNGVSPWGGAAETVQKAMVILSKKVGHLAGESPLYATPAFPAGAGPDFVNAAIRVTTPLSAADLLTALHAVEAEAARERTVRWGQRTLDLDLIDYNGLVVPETAGNGPILPHPRVAERAFVLGPLVDIAPVWRHPILGTSANELFEAVPIEDRQGLKRLSSGSKG